MKLILIITIIVLWVILYIGLYFFGSYIIDKLKTTFVKRWGSSEEIYYSEQKKDFHLYLTLFFLLIPILVIGKIVSSL